MRRLRRAGLAAGALALASACRADTLAFEWAIGSFAGAEGQPVAILLNARIGTRTCALQLDTGLAAAVAWHAGADAADTERAPVRIQLGRITRSVAASPAVRALIAACEPSRPVGSLGNAFFDHGTLTLDLRHGRLRHEAGSHLQAGAGGTPFRYAATGGEGGHVLVELALPDGPATALLDTGSAALDLGAFSPDAWTRLTGLSPQRTPAAARAFSVHAWGRMHPCHIAAASVPVRVGGQALAAPTVTHCPGIGPGWSGVIGVVGMKPFRDKRLVIDYPARLWRVEQP